MEVEIVAQQYKVGGIVVDSNFLNEGVRHMVPIDDKIAKKLKKGDKLKITHFTMDSDIHASETRLSFKNKGTRYEVWNNENEGWDKIGEHFPEPSDDE